MSKYDEYMNMIQSRSFLRHTVTQDNALVRAKYNYNYRELKLSRLISSKINPLDPNQGFTISIRKDEVNAYFMSKGAKKYGSLYSDFDILMNGLNSKPITIVHKKIDEKSKKEQKKKIVAYWVSDYEYDYMTQTYNVNIPQKIRPFLIALKNSYTTSIPLYVYDVIHKVHLCRLYEILYSFRNMKGGRVIYKDWKELADQIGCNYEWKHFNNRILKPAQKLFPEVTSLGFSFKTTKKPKSKAIQGIELTVTIEKRKIENKEEQAKHPTLFPQASNDEIQLVEDIKHTLAGWGIDLMQIEQIIHDPYSFIGSDAVYEAVEKKYNRLEYVGSKIDYVNQTREIKKSKASLFFAALKNNYESAKKVKETNDNKKKEFEENRERDIADIENERAAIQQQHQAVALSVVEGILTNNDTYRKYVFDIARKSHANLYDMGLEDTALYNNSNPVFRATIVSNVQKDHSQFFDKINIIRKEKLDDLTKREWGVINRKLI